ncbi:hypothetical protein Tco_0588886 [Tanacetum coccineum]
MFYPRFTKIIIHHFLEKDKSILMRNRTFMHTARDDSLLGTMRFVSRHEDAQIYGAILLKAVTNQAMLDSVAYKTYYAIASGAKPPKSKKPKTKSDSSISSEETPSKKKPTKAKKDVPSKKKPASKPKPTKKKAPVKADRGKGLNVLSEVALSEADQLKEATKQNKKDFYISHASGSEEDDDDNDDSDSNDDDDDNDDSDGNDDDDDNDDNDGGDDDDNDANDDDNQEDDDKNDDEEETDSDRTKPDRIKIPVLNQSNTKYYEEEEEKIDDEEKMDEEKDDEVTKELYKDMNVNLGNEDADITNAESGFKQEEEDAHVTLITVHDTQKTEGPRHSYSVSYDFTEKLLNFKNVSPADNEIASLMDTTVCHEEQSSQTYTLFIVPITTIPPPPHFFNPLPQKTAPTHTPTASDVTTSVLVLLGFASEFRFNDRVTNLERDLSEIKQVDQYAQALSFIPVIVDRYINNKLGKAIQKAIQTHNLDCKEEAQAKK